MISHVSRLQYGLLRERASLNIFLFTGPGENTAEAEKKPRLPGLEERRKVHPATPRCAGIDFDRSRSLRARTVRPARIYPFFGIGPLSPFGPVAFECKR